MAILNDYIICTLAQIAGQTLDPNSLYSITDYPVGGITNAQMGLALTPQYNAFFMTGDTFICVDNGTYTKGRAYRFTGVAWELVTEFDASPTQDSVKPVTSGGVYSYIESTVGNINTILEGLL